MTTEMTAAQSEGVKNSTTAPPAVPEVAAEEPAWEGGLPLFYRKLRLVNAERHRHAGLKQSAGFGFARSANAVPLGADELFDAQAHCPIVFTESDPPMPVAILGVGHGHNSFVAEDGTWRAGSYIPAYIRRYPFILATGIAPGEAHLAIDEEAEGFSASEGKPLFEAGVPTGMTRQALEFCRAFQLQFELSRAFGEALQSAGILESKRADIRQPDGALQSLEKFCVADEAKLDTLDTETFLAWRRKGWLGLVYAHLLSMRKWQQFIGPGTAEGRS